MSEQDFPVEQDTPVWIWPTDLIPADLRRVGWTLWAVGNGPTLFGTQRYMAVLLKDREHPNGTRAAGDGATQEDAVRAAIRDALAIEAASRDPVLGRPEHGALLGSERRRRRYLAGVPARGVAQLLGSRAASTTRRMANTASGLRKISCPASSWTN